MALDVVKIQRQLPICCSGDCEWGGGVCKSWDGGGVRLVTEVGRIKRKKKGVK